MRERQALTAGRVEMAEFQQNLSEKSRRDARLLEYSFLALAVLLGLCRAWAGRNCLMDIDGVSYIDIGRAYWHGDWQTALNPVWSPLYSWLVGAALKAFRPSLYWAIPLVQLVNFLIYLVTLFCFRFLLTGLMSYHEGRSGQYQRMSLAIIPKSVWIALGYTAFMVGTLEMIEVTNVRPDMCVAAFFFLASGIVVRMHTKTAGWKIYFLLGVCLGLGYLAKAALFPLAFVFILASFVPRDGVRQGLRHLALALLGLGLISGPYIALLSRRQGHFTFSEAAPLNYAWFVNNVTEINFMSDNAPGYGHPAHPLRRIFNDPIAFEFGSPVPGSYPENFNTAYWWKGVKPHFHFLQQLRRLGTSAHQLFRLFFSPLQAGLLTAILALYLLSPTFRLAMRNVAAQWFMLLPPVAGLAMYASVFVLPRYLGSFFTVFWLGLIAGWCLPNLPHMRRVVSAVALAGVLVTLSAILGSTYQDVRTQTSLGPVEWRVAEYLREIGIQPGDQVGRLMLGYNLGWAVLDRVRVTAEVDLDPEQAPDYLTASDQVKEEVLGALFRTGVKAIVADHLERTGCVTGWRTVAKTDYSVCVAPPTAAGSRESPLKGTGAGF